MMHMNTDVLSRLDLLKLKRLSLRDGRWRHLSCDVSPLWVTWLGGEAVEFQEEVYPTRDMLVELKQKSRSRGTWFNDLNNEQRSLMDLVIHVVKDKVRGLLLAKVLAAIVKRLLNAIGGIQALIGEIAYKMKKDGLPLAHKLSRIAQAWGNKSASQWPEDKGFIQYLPIMEKYKPT